MSFANKIVVTHKARAVYTARVPVHGTYTAVYTVRHGPYAAVYTARSRPCTQPCTHAYVYTALIRPCTRPVHSRIHDHVHGPYTALQMFVYTGRVHGRVHGPSCTWRVGLPGHVHVPRRHATAVCGPLWPCTRPIHSPFTAVYMSTPQLKGRVRAMYTASTVVYMAGRPTRPCTRPR